VQPGRDFYALHDDSTAENGRTAANQILANGGRKPSYDAPSARHKIN
jgi:hypothetical protein